VIIEIPDNYLLYVDMEAGVTMFFDPKKVDLSYGLANAFFPPSISELSADRPDDKHT
jgi:hypothetical protein